MEERGEHDQIYELVLNSHQCCHVPGSPAELGFFNTVAAGYFSYPRVEETPIT